MKAVGYTDDLPVEQGRRLVDLELPIPQPGPRDVLVRIAAVAVNPLDPTMRRRKGGSPEAPMILGWDAAGVVERIGPAVTLFKPGDEVYYCGSIARPGCNAEYGLVDERIAALKPRSLSFTEAAALPLTAITAWESLFERLKIRIGKAATDDAILVIGAAGGVGSMATQLARRLTGLRVIGTASRPASRAWLAELGAHDIVDHTKPLSQELARIGRPTVRYIYCLTQTLDHWDEIAKCLAPQGEVCLIDIPTGLDALKIRPKAGSLHFEMMMVKVLFETPDMIQIHRLLTDVASMVDSGIIRTTAGVDLGPINAANIRRAHSEIETKRTVGKITLTGFGARA